MCDARGQGERVCEMRVLFLVQARLARCRELDELLLHYAVHGAQVTVETGGIQRKKSAVNSKTKWGVYVATRERERERWKADIEPWARTSGGNLRPSRPLVASANDAS